jgi:hypothetical protein
MSPDKNKITWARARYWVHDCTWAILYFNFYFLLCHFTWWLFTWAHIHLLAQVEIQSNLINPSNKFSHDYHLSLSHSARLLLVKHLSERVDDFYHNSNRAQRATICLLLLLMSRVKEAVMLLLNFLTLSLSVQFKCRLMVDVWNKQTTMTAVHRWSAIEHLIGKL